MNKKYIIDASALLAVIYQERINESVESYFENSIMHNINVSETLAILQIRGMPNDIAEDIIKSTISEIRYSNYEETSLAATIKANHTKFGISLGDSFCLAAGQLLNLPILTADKIWSQLGLNCEIILIR